MSEISGDIITEAAKGDIKAFESIYKEYFGFVANVASRIVNSADDAEDVAQEVFMAIYRRLKTFRGESTLKTWIYRITLNTALNRAKRMTRENKQTLEYKDGIAITQIPSNTDDLLKKAEKEKEIVRLLDALNPDQRACIVLRSLEGLSYHEISEILNIPINTVRSRIKRARESMMSLQER
jgi:RNA polymerase sigma-70 factor (ECF subfamily)